MTATPDLPADPIVTKSLRPGRRTETLVLLLGLLLWASTAFTQTDDAERILVLHGVWEAGPWDMNIDRGIVDALNLSEDSSLQVSFQYLGIDSGANGQRREEISTNIESMIRQQDISIIVAVQPIASQFLLQLDIPDSLPKLLLLPNPETIEAARQRNNIAVVESAFRVAINQTLGQILLLRPESETIFVVGGNSGDDILYVDYVRQIAANYDDQFSFEYLIGVPPERLEQRLASLDSSDTVLSLPFSAYTDADGSLAPVGSVYLDRMIGSIPAPLFGIYDRLLGQGLAGGALSSTEGYSGTVGRLLLDYLDSGDWEEFLTPGEAYTLYDWNEVEQWDLDLSRLDTSYQLINQPATLWDTDPILVIGFINVVLALLLVVAVMAFLLSRSRRAQLAIAASERVARENEEKYRLLATNTVDVIWTWNGRTEEVTYSSPSIENLTGYTPAEFCAKPLHEHMTPESFHRCIGLYDQGPTSREQLIEVQHITKSGDTVWCEMSAHAVYTEIDDDTWVGVTRDISRRKAEEGHRVQLEASVRQNQKFESLGTLAGGIAHDFNNVLGVMMGLIDLLADESLDRQQAKPLIEKLNSSAQKAKRLVQRILTFARQREGEKQVMDLSALLEESVDLIESGTPANIDVITDTPDQPIKVEADFTQLEQVILNIATNAIDALTQTGGTIRFRLDTRQILAAADYPHGSVKPGRYARLIVEDDGVGIDIEARDRIFDPFYTSKDMGSGMGLAIVRSIVMHHDGAIDLHSEAGKGTEFEVLLPLSNGELVVDDDCGRALSADKPLNILVIDDQESVLETARMMLERLGHKCQVSVDPLAAMESIRENSAELDLVITDYSMPKLNGMELAEQCAREYPELLVLLSTGFGDSLPRHTVLANGRPLKILHKPYSFKELRQFLKEVARDPKAA